MIFALCGQKGGSGKTTVAIYLSAELVARGCKVLLVDADPQGTSRTWGALAAENGHAAPTVIAMGATMHVAGQLTAMSGQYDHVVIDCPPRHGEIQRSALAVADLAILPCGPSAPDGWALAESIDLVNAARERFPKLRAIGLITKKVARTALGKMAREVLASGGLDVAKTELHYRVAYQEALAAGLGVGSYANQSPAANEITNLVDELIGERHGRRKTYAPSKKTAARRARR